MKRRLFTLILLMVGVGRLFAQTAQPTFSNKDIFKTNYFIENKGQFDHKLPHQRIYFGYHEPSSQVYFTQDRVVWELSKMVEGKHHGELTERNEKEREEHMERKTTLVSMHWLNTNSQVSIVKQGKSNHYFSYGDKQYISYGYEKLIYKNIYPFVDLEYIIPEKGGIKYSLILHPGAQVEQIKLAYEGDGVKVSRENGQLSIRNAVTTIKESELQVFDEHQHKLPCSYVKQGNRLGFALEKSVNLNQTITIDPWVVPITTLIGTNGNNVGYDIDYDYLGNLYVYGGGMSGDMKIAKYDPSGTLQWTWNGTVPSISWSTVAWGSYVGNFAVDKLKSKIYCGEGANYSGGVTIVRLDSAGVYDNFVSVPNPVFTEIWDMAFDCATGNILGMGGGTTSDINMGTIDTNGAFTSTNFTSVPGWGQDVVSAALSPNGELFALMASVVGTPSLDNKLIRVNSALNGNLWIAPSGFLTMMEADNKDFLGLGSTSNGYNVLHANSSYLYYWDGSNLKAYNKSNGNPVGTPLSITGFPMMSGGIYVDECNNVYLGGMNGDILVYHFDGLTFNLLPSITIAGMSGKRIHDIKYNSGNGLLYVCGDQFVTTLPRSQTCVDTSSLNSTLTIDCAFSAVQVLNAGSGNYSYIWTDSNTNTVVQSVYNSSQTSDTLFSLINGHTYTVLIIKNVLCGGAAQSYHFVANGGLNIYYNPVICPGQSFTVNGHVYTTSGVYHDTLFASVGCDTIITTNLSLVPAITQTNNPVICSGQSITVNGHVYSTTGTYIDSLQTASGCDSIVTTHLTVNPSTSFTQNLSLCDGDTLYVNGHAYYQSGSYHDTLVNALSCDSILITNLSIVQFQSATQNVSICQGKSVTVNNHVYYTAGTYTDTLLNANSCDTVLTTIVQVINNTFFQQDIALCDGQSITINGHTYTQPGHYTDTVLNSKLCDSIIITDIHLGKAKTRTIDSSICAGASIQINNHIYTQPGTYLDTLKTSLGCDSIITTNLTVLDFDKHSFVPNAFSPNGDFINDCFGVSFWQDITEFKFLIYNRWGQEVFRTTQLWDCWNGNFEGEPAPLGVYFYYIVAKTSCGGVIEKKGDISLIR